MAGRFDLFQDKAGKYRFNLKAANGQVIATSQAYESKSAGLNGIDSVRRHAPDAVIVEREQ